MEQTHQEDRTIEKEKKPNSFRKTIDRELKRTAAIAAIGVKLISGSAAEIHKIDEDVAAELNEPIRTSQSQYVENKSQNELTTKALDNIDNVLDEIIDMKKKKREQDEVTSTAGKKIEIR